MWNSSLSQADWGATLLTTLALHSWPSVIDSLSTFLAMQPVTPYIRTRINDGLTAARNNSRWIATNWPDMSAYLTSGAWKRPTPRHSGGGTATAVISALHFATLNREAAKGVLHRLHHHRRKSSAPD